MTEHKLVPSRDDLIQCLLATRGQSEGATADAILSMLAPDVTALVEALERIAESRDTGRHDGLPEEGPALCATVSWGIAKDALAAYRKGDES